MTPGAARWSENSVCRASEGKSHREGWATPLPPYAAHLSKCGRALELSGAGSQAAGRSSETAAPLLEGWDRGGAWRVDGGSWGARARASGTFTRLSPTLTVPLRLGSNATTGFQTRGKCLSRERARAVDTVLTLLPRRRQPRRRETVWSGASTGSFSVTCPWPSSQRGVPDT